MRFLATITGAAILAASPLALTGLAAQEQSQAIAAPQQASDADLIDLADYADLVVRAKVRRQSALEPLSLIHI